VAALVVMFVRTRCLRHAGWLCLGAVLAEWATAGDSLLIPWSRVKLTVAAAPLVPAALAAVQGFALLRTMPELERRVGRTLTGLRLAWAGVLTVLAAAGAQVASSAASGTWGPVFARNSVAFTGVALLGAVVFGARLAWVPVLVLALATFSVGRDMETGTPYAWAWLLRPSHSATSTVVSLAVAVTGVVLYACLDSRASRGLPEG
jgi:hypothetical protein